MGIGKIIDKLIDKALEFSDKTSIETAYTKLCKKFPKHRKLIWFLFQIKSLSIYFLWLYILFVVVKMCNPETVCPFQVALQKQFINGTPINMTNYNLTNMIK